MQVRYCRKLLSKFDLTIPAERRVQAKLAVKDEYTFDFAELSPEYSEHELEMQLYLTALDEQVKLPDENQKKGMDFPLQIE